MILEGIVTTENADGSVNVSPMGPLVDDDMNTLVLRPFKTSTTFANLQRTGEGVFHVTDNVEMLAQAAIGSVDPPPVFLSCDDTSGKILADACRWYAFRVDECDDREQRAQIHCTVVARGALRDFIGFNRAKHAVLEAAIMATRLHILPAAQIDDEMRRLAVIVDKTAGEQERRALSLLESYIERKRVSL
ncbi:MAG: DUF447 family protein [Planctomycetales bacterium]|nr:DUF447 family protein [Planctomycetales bacterium]